jgi:hypothetical protein
VNFKLRAESTMGHRLSDSAPLYALIILAAIGIVATVVIFTVIYAAFHGISPL